MSHTGLPLRAFHLPLSPKLMLAPPQIRPLSLLTSLKPPKGHTHTRKRLGRGPSSGKGKTSGRGHKGQKQHGHVPANFTGGQTPVAVTHGARGFVNVLAKDMRTVNVDRIQWWIDQGRIDAGRMVTVKELEQSGCMHGLGEGVKLLARNATQMKTPVHIIVSRASRAAIAAVENAGGTVQTRYYTKDALGRVLKGLTHPFLSALSPPVREPGMRTEYESGGGGDGGAGEQRAERDTHPNTAAFPPPSQYRYRLPDPVSRKELEYYRDPAHRGYLSYQVEDGHGPSLYFKSPEQLRDEAKQREREKQRRAAGKVEGDEKVDLGRIW